MQSAPPIFSEKQLAALKKTHRHQLPVGPHYPEQGRFITLILVTIQNSVLNVTNGIAPMHKKAFSKLFALTNPI